MIVLEKTAYEYSYVMEKLAGELEGYGFAVNCRGNLVNLRHISKIKGYDIYMDNGQILALSQKRVAYIVYCFANGCCNSMDFCVCHIFP